MTQTALCLPWPPSINGYFASVRGRQILTAKAREYREDAIALIGQQWSLPTFTGRVFVGMVMHPPTRRSFDIKNFDKAILDALTDAGVYEDDKQIDLIKIRRGEVVPGGEVIVLVEPLADALKTEGRDG